MRSWMLEESRVVPTLSYGFIEAISRNVDFAATLPTRGTTISRSAIAVRRVLSVSSGAPFNSSMYRKPPSRIAASRGPSTKLSGV
jgi:hypothetical protein